MYLRFFPHHPFTLEGYALEFFTSTKYLITEIKTYDMNHSCIQQISYIFLFSPSGAQSCKPRIFIVTFYDRSFSSPAAASLLLRPFFAFLTVFLHNCSAMRKLPPVLVPRLFFTPFPPLYLFIFRIVMLLVLRSNYSIRSGHFVSSSE